MLGIAPDESVEQYGVGDQCQGYGRDENATPGDSPGCDRAAQPKERVRDEERDDAQQGRHVPALHRLLVSRDDLGRAGDEGGDIVDRLTGRKPEHDEHPQVERRGSGERTAPGFHAGPEDEDAQDERGERHLDERENGEECRVNSRRPPAQALGLQAVLEAIDEDQDVWNEDDGCPFLDVGEDRRQADQADPCPVTRISQEASHRDQAADHERVKNQLKCEDETECLRMIERDRQESEGAVGGQHLRSVSQPLNMGHVEKVFVIMSIID